MSEEEKGDDMEELFSGLPEIVPTPDQKERLQTLAQMPEFAVFGEVGNAFHEAVQDRLVYAAGCDIESSEYAKTDVYLGQLAVCRMIQKWFQ